MRGARLAVLTLVPLLAWPAVLAEDEEAEKPPPPVKVLLKDLKRGIDDKDQTKLADALGGLRQHGGEKSVTPVLRAIPDQYSAKDSRVYWQLVNGASGFADEEALATIGETLTKNKKKEWARDLLHALGGNPSLHVTAALGPVMRECPPDMQEMAADHLGLVHSTESVQILIEELQRKKNAMEPELRRRVLGALAAITGENMGDTLNWIGWWDANKAKGLKLRKKKGGESATNDLNKTRDAIVEKVKGKLGAILVISARLPADDPHQPNRDHNYDHVEEVLEGLKIPHRVVTKTEFIDDTKKYLKDAWVILVNCNNIQSMCVCKTCGKDRGAKSTNRMFTCPPDCPDGHERVSYKMPEDVVERIKTWTETGGYLFTEDWGLVEIVDEAWPKYVSSEETIQIEGNPNKQVELVEDALTVPVYPGRGLITSPLLRGVFTKRRKPVKGEGVEVEEEEESAQGAEGEEDEEEEEEGDDEVDWGDLEDMGAEDGDAPSEGGGGGDGESGTSTRNDPAGGGVGGAHFKWEIDAESPVIFVRNPKAVKVLIRSEDLAKKAKGQDAVAVSFLAGSRRAKKGGRAGSGNTETRKKRGSKKRKRKGRKSLGRGRVLHVLSHFGKQQGSYSGTYALKNMILNFVLESARNHTE